MYEWERDKVVKNWNFGKGNTITVDKRRNIKKIMNYSILTIPWN